MLVSRLRNEPPIEARGHRLRRQIDLEINIGMTDAHQEDDLTHRVGHVFGGHDRLRHPREAGEFVDHALDVVDLAHDGRGALLEHGGILNNHLRVFAA